MENKKLMNKMKFYSKKTFAVMLALVMMMSCWVFTPMIEAEAEAITQGTYYFMLVLEIVTSFNVDGESYITVENSDGEDMCSEEIASYLEGSEGSGYKFYYFSSTTLPRSIELTGTKDNPLEDAKLICSLYVDSSAYSDENRGTITTASMSSIVSTKGTRSAELFYYETGTVVSMDTTENIYTSAYASTIYSSKTSDSVTVPTSETITIDVYFCIKDQYGVTFPISPTVTATSLEGVNITSSEETYGYVLKIEVTPSALTAGSTSSNTVTVTANYGVLRSQVYTLTIDNPTFTYTFDGNGGTLTSDSSNTITVGRGNVVGTLPTYTLDNYSLVGFSTDKLDYIYSLTDTNSISNK